MPIETRFARGPGAPVPYRVDGNGSRGLLIISDWGAPYGAPGHAAFDAFVDALSRRGARTLTVLDGSVGPRRDAPDTAERINAARAVAEADELSRATVLGVADGVRVAAALAAEGGSLVERLILFDTFAADQRDQWGLDEESAVATLPQAASPTRVIKEFQNKGEASDWLRGMWRSVRQEVKDDPEAARVIDSLMDGDNRWSGGIGRLLRNVALVEETNPGRGERSMLSSIDVPTLVLEAQSEGSIGLDIAAQIPGSRHRLISQSSRWPWATPGIEQAILDAGPASSTAAAPLAAPAEVANDRILATVLFTDIVGSSERLAEVGDRAWRDLLEQHNRIVRSHLARLGGREIDNSGDGFFATFDIPARAVSCAVAIRDDVRQMGLAIRAGLHTGECERIDDNLLGIAVHIGARIAAKASANQILVSATVRDLVAGAGINFVEHGVASLKGIPGEWRLFEVVG